MGRIKLYHTGYGCSHPSLIHHANHQEGFTLDRELEIQHTDVVQKTELQAVLTGSDKSALRKYQEIFIGSTRLLDLLRYELITTLISPLPGALGFFLRKLFFPLLFHKVGRNVVFGRSITIRHPHKISIGDNVIIDDYAVLDAKGDDSRIEIDSDVIIGRGTVLSCKGGILSIGSSTNIAMQCFIQSGKKTVIGKNVLFAAYCYVIGGGDHLTSRTDIPIIAQGQVVRGITIEDNCWIGAGVNVLDGTRIGRDSIIGAGAVVNRDIPEFSIAVGVPARVTRRRTPVVDEW